MFYVEALTDYSCAGPDLTLFLGGGITGTADWQKEIVAKLSSTDLTLLNPRRAVFDGSAEAQIKWEHSHLLRSDAILFWFPPETLCPIALYELGAWVFRPKKLFVGCHPDYKRRFDVEVQVSLERPKLKIVYSLDDLANQVIEWESRKQGERYAKDEEQPRCQNKS